MNEYAHLLRNFSAKQLGRIPAWYIDNNGERKNLRIRANCLPNRGILSTKIELWSAFIADVGWGWVEISDLTPGTHVRLEYEYSCPNFIVASVEKFVGAGGIDDSVISRTATYVGGERSTSDYATIGHMMTRIVFANAFGIRHACDRDDSGELYFANLSTITWH